MFCVVCLGNELNKVWENPLSGQKTNETVHLACPVKLLTECLNVWIDKIELSAVRNFYRFDPKHLFHRTHRTVIAAIQVIQYVSTEAACTKKNGSVPNVMKIVCSNCVRWETLDSLATWR